ncbi:hypothetical protein A6D99_18045 [Aliivibrio fischeri]|nr:hypothetical protein A6D99_18045 [Aliivibrio fischeri]
MKLNTAKGRFSWLGFFTSVETRMSEVDTAKWQFSWLGFLLESLAACHARGRVAFKVDRKSCKCSHLFKKALIERLGLFYIGRNRNK